MLGLKLNYVSKRGHMKQNDHGKMQYRAYFNEFSSEPIRTKVSQASNLLCRKCVPVCLLLRAKTGPPEDIFDRVLYLSEKERCFCDALNAIITWSFVPKY